MSHLTLPYPTLPSPAPRRPRPSPRYVYQAAKPASQPASQQCYKCNSPPSNTRLLLGTGNWKFLTKTPSLPSLTAWTVNKQLVFREIRISLNWTLRQSNTGFRSLDILLFLLIIAKLYFPPSQSEWFLILIRISGMMVSGDWWVVITLVDSGW